MEPYAVTTWRMSDSAPLYAVVIVFAALATIVGLGALLWIAVT